jgi:hypothetical protein
MVLDSIKSDLEYLKKLTTESQKLSKLLSKQLEDPRKLHTQLINNPSY